MRSILAHLGDCGIHVPHSPLCRGMGCVSKGRYLPHLTSSMLPDLAEPCRGQFTTPLRVYATATTLLNRTASLGGITTWPVCLKLPSHYSKYQEVVGAEQRFMTQPPTPLQSYLPGSHDIMYLLTCKLAVSRFATARVGSPNRPDFAGHKNRGGAPESLLRFCLGTSVRHRPQFRTARNLRRWPTPVRRQFDSGGRAKSGKTAPSK